MYNYKGKGFKEKRGRKKKGEKHVKEKMKEKGQILKVNWDLEFKKKEKKNEI